MPDILIYSSKRCGYCHAATDLLDRLGLAYREIDVTDDTEKRQEMLQAAHGRRSVPQIFIDGQGIGGYTDLYRYIAENRYISPD